MVCGHGINDMQYGWRIENEWNKRVYRTWHNMLKRCYDEKYHEKQPTYKNCSVYNRWLLLSNFVEDFKLIDGYNEEKFLNGELCLDKDIKSNGTNKEYCLEECMLVSKSENSKQSNKTMDYSSIKGENNPRSIKICQCDKKGNFIKIWNSSMDIKRELGINQSDIIACCKWYACGENLEEWYKTHKKYPHKTARGFIFKYAIEEQ